MALTKVVRPLRGGQITIPAEFRSKLEIDERTLLQVTLAGQELRIRPVHVTDVARGSAWARELYDLFAPVRKEAGRHAGKEIDADIDRAVADVRRQRGSRRS
jgi:bifunctional DNA-binding transcriptional regulator/antitoxin component of YhaV-PrlF toxin-antitoxin module